MKHSLEKFPITSQELGQRTDIDGWLPAMYGGTEERGELAHEESRSVDSLIAIHETTDNPKLRNNIGEYLESAASELVQGDTPVANYIVGFLSGAEQAAKSGRTFIDPAWVTLTAPEPSSVQEVKQFAQQLKEVDQALNILGFEPLSSKELHGNSLVYASDIFPSIRVAGYESRNGRQFIYTAGQAEQAATAA